MRHPKKATKLTTMKQYVRNAEAGVAANGNSLWIQYVFHRYCEVHCGAYTIQPTKFKVLTLRVTVLSSSAVASRSLLVKVTAIRQTTKVDAVKAIVNKA